MEHIRVGFFRVFGDPLDVAPIESASHSNQTNAIAIQSTQFGEFARFQANEVCGHAKIRQSIAEDLLDAFCSRKVFAVDQVQRRQSTLCWCRRAMEYDGRCANCRAE